MRKNGIYYYNLICNHASTREDWYPPIYIKVSYHNAEAHLCGMLDLKSTSNEYNAKDVEIANALRILWSYFYKDKQQICFKAFIDKLTPNNEKHFSNLSTFEAIKFIVKHKDFDIKQKCVPCFLHFDDVNEIWNWEKSNNMQGDIFQNILRDIGNAFFSLLKFNIYLIPCLSGTNRDYIIESFAATNLQPCTLYLNLLTLDETWEILTEYLKKEFMDKDNCLL